MTDKKCPLGEDCDLTIAWMAGAGRAKSAYMARIEALETKLEKAHLALNYFLMRDPDKPTYWEYRRDRAEELARDVLGATQELTGGKDD